LPKHIIVSALVASIALTTVSGLYAEPALEYVAVDQSQIVNAAQMRKLIETSAQTVVTLTDVYSAARDLSKQLEVPETVLINDYLAQYPVPSTAKLKCDQGFIAVDSVVTLPDGSFISEPTCYRAKQQVEESVTGFNADIDLSNYSSNAKDRGWGNGWPAARSDIVPVSYNGSNVAVLVNKSIAELTQILINETTRRYEIKSLGGYSNRPIAGTRVASNHSWGLALDFNPAENPQQRTLVTDIPDDVISLWKRYGFAWGGNYKQGTLLDPMHFEFMGTPADAKTLTDTARAEFVDPPKIVDIPAILEPVTDLIGVN